MTAVRDDAPYVARRPRRLAAVLAVVLALVTVMAATGTGLGALDGPASALARTLMSPTVDALGKVLERVGQRGVMLPLLLVLALWVARRERSWRAPLLLLASALAMNAVVGVGKMFLGRPSPRRGGPDFFENGFGFPSGHATGAVIYWGVAVLMVAPYLSERALRRASYAPVVTASTVAVCSMIRGTHWPTDLIAGFLVGVLILQAIAAFDVALRAGRATRWLPQQAPVRLPVRTAASGDGLLVGARMGADSLHDFSRDGLSSRSPGVPTPRPRPVRVAAKPPAPALGSRTAA